MADTAFDRLRQRIARDSPVTWDLEGIRSEVYELNDLERGRLLGPLWATQLDPDHGPRQLEALAGMLESSAGQDQFGPPLFDAPSADAALVAIADHLKRPVPATVAQRATAQFSADTIWLLRLGHCADMVCMRLVEEPGPEGRAALGKLLESDLPPNPISRLIATRLTGEVEREARLIAQLRAVQSGPICRAEIDALLSAPVLRWEALLQPYGRSAFVSQGKDDDPSDLPAYRSFAEWAVTEALSAVRAVQTGAVPYKADKLMSKDDASAVGRAMQCALAGNLSWGTDALEELWRGTAFAPDPKAKTLPSQTLTYELGHAVVAEPRPEAVLLMREIAAQARHATVKKRLGRFAKNALTELGKRPERVLDMAGYGPLAPDLLKLLKPALEGLLLRDWFMDLAVWTPQMTDAGIWPLASRLIWTVEEGGVRFTAIPAKSRTEWQLADGALCPMRPEQRVRLWHPAESGEAEREGWRAVVAQGKPQPFAQAFRELYTLPDAKGAGDVTDVFAGVMIAQVPAIGLARRIGFALGYGDEIDLELGGQRFRLHAGVRSYPGAGGEGETGAVQLLGPARCFDDVPPRVLNEALRRIDLVIATGAAGVQDSAPIKIAERADPVWPGAQSLEMRRALLRLTRPEARYDGRWLLLGDGLRVHLGTGRMDLDGTPMDPPDKIRRKATARADDRVMDTVWAAIAQHGLA